MRGFIAVLLWSVAKAAPQKHPTRVIIGYSDTCNTSVAAAMRTSPLISTYEASVVTEALASNGAPVFATANSVEHRRHESLQILSTLVSLRNNGGQPSSASSAIAVASRPERLSKEYFKNLQMEVIEDSEGKQTSDQLAAIASALPCMQFDAEPDMIYPKEEMLGPVIGPHKKQRPTLESRGNSTEAYPISISEPNDEYHHYQWSHNLIKLHEAWNVFTGATKGLTVAVVDTGCSFNRDLAHNFWVDPDIPACQGATANTPKFDRGCYGRDFAEEIHPFKEGYEHGTSVAGLVAASTNNGLAVSGACWGCKIACVKAANRNGGFPASGLIGAYDYILEKKFKVSNHSYGTYINPKYSYSDTWAFTKMLNKLPDHLAIVAAGNDGCDMDSPYGSHRCTDDGAMPWPGGDTHDNVISVGSMCEKLRKSGFSNWGKKSVDLFAPGSNVIILENTYLNSDSHSGLRYGSGTSFAAPLVAGVVSMVWGANPEFTARQVKERLLQTVSKSAALGDKCVSGGYVNAYEAIGRNPPVRDGPVSFTPPRFDQTADFYRDFSTANEPNTAVTTPRSAGRSVLPISGFGFVISTVVLFGFFF